MEQPRLVEAEETKREFSVYDQVVLLAKVNEIVQSSAKEELREEVLKTFVLGTLDKSQNWLVFSKSLLERSRVEKDKYKTKYGNF